MYLSEVEVHKLGCALTALGEQELEGADLEALAIEILVIDEAVDAETASTYKANRAKGYKPGAALFHAKEKVASTKAADDKRSALTSKYKSLGALDKRPGKKLPAGEKMVFGKVVKVGAAHAAA